MRNIPYTVGWFKFQLFFILTMAKVHATSFGSKNMISSKKKILTRLGYVRIFSTGAFIHDFFSKFENVIIVPKNVPSFD